MFFKLPELSETTLLVLMILGVVFIPIIIIYLIRILFRENFTSNKPYREILFFTLDSCGHCKNMKPAWELLKNNYGKNQFIKLVEVNAKNQKLVDLYNVQGFPTILYVKDEKKQTEYNGDRSYEDLVKFLKHSMSN